MKTNQRPFIKRNIHWYHRHKRICSRSILEIRKHYYMHINIFAWLLYLKFIKMIKRGFLMIHLNHFLLKIHRVIIIHRIKLICAFNQRCVIHIDIYLIICIHCIRRCRVWDIKRNIIQCSIDSESSIEGELSESVATIAGISDFD